MQVRKLVPILAACMMFTSHAQAAGHRHHHHRHHYHHHHRHHAANRYVVPVRYQQVDHTHRDCLFGFLCSPVRATWENVKLPFVQPARRYVAQMVARATARRIGKKWVPTALKIAKFESGFSCHAVGPHTRHGRALGVFQVMPSSLRKIGADMPPRKLLTCQGGIEAGIDHMAYCIHIGANTPARMAACHVGGSPKIVDRYARWYVRTVIAER